MKERLNLMKNNHPDLFGQFLFAATIMSLSFLQIVSVIFACVFL